MSSNILIIDYFAFSEKKVQISVKSPKQASFEWKSWCRSP